MMFKILQQGFTYSLNPVQLPLPLDYSHGNKSLNLDPKNITATLTLDSYQANDGKEHLLEGLNEHLDGWEALYEQESNHINTLQSSNLTGYFHAQKFGTLAKISPKKVVVVRMQTPEDLVAYLNSATKSLVYTPEKDLGVIPQITKSIVSSKFNDIPNKVWRSIVKNSVEVWARTGQLNSEIIDRIQTDKVYVQRLVRSLGNRYEMLMALGLRPIYLLSNFHRTIIPDLDLTLYAKRYGALDQQHLGEGLVDFLRDRSWGIVSRLGPVYRGEAFNEFENKLWEAEPRMILGFHKMGAICRKVARLFKKRHVSTRHMDHILADDEAIKFLKQYIVHNYRELYYHFIREKSFPNANSSKRYKTWGTTTYKREESYPDQKVPSIEELESCLNDSKEAIHRTTAGEKRFLNPLIIQLSHSKPENCSLAGWGKVTTGSLKKLTRHLGLNEAFAQRMKSDKAYFSSVVEMMALRWQVIHEENGTSSSDSAFYFTTMVVTAQAKKAYHQRYNPIDHKEWMPKLVSRMSIKDMRSQHRSPFHAKMQRTLKNVLLPKSPLEIQLKVWRRCLSDFISALYSLNCSLHLWELIQENEMLLHKMALEYYQKWKVPRVHTIIIQTPISISRAERACTKKIIDFGKKPVGYEILDNSAVHYLTPKNIAYADGIYSRRNFVSFNGLQIRKPELVNSLSERSMYADHDKDEFGVTRFYFSDIYATPSAPMAIRFVSDEYGQLVLTSSVKTARPILEGMRKTPFDEWPNDLDKGFQTDHESILIGKYHYKGNVYGVYQPEFWALWNTWFEEYGDPEDEDHFRLWERAFVTLGENEVFNILDSLGPEESGNLGWVEEIILEVLEDH